MEIEGSPFKMLSFYRPLPDESPIELPSIRILYRTEEEIAGPTTTEEIFNLYQVFLKQIIEEYNRYQIEENRAIITAYHLSIAWEVEKDGLKKVDGKELYHVAYNVEEKNIVEEKKSYLPPETIERIFFIFIGVTVYYQ